MKAEKVGRISLPSDAKDCKPLYFLIIKQCGGQVLDKLRVEISKELGKRTFTNDLLLDAKSMLKKERQRLRKKRQKIKRKAK